MQPPPERCNQTSRRFYPHQTDCQKYYECAVGLPPVEYSCAATTRWSIKMDNCDWDYNVPSTRIKEDNMNYWGFDIGMNETTDEDVSDTSMILRDVKYAIINMTISNKPLTSDLIVLRPKFLPV